ncbi:hypothetical protein IC762_27040 [Bradyrhizobium genosp. L]|uniref:hypothetical protein n=1 Tax=Bradyrhizobium genosp. L TaxID=83637 RepID=UPI0018A32C4C|nr:hypothetical protein [Bradyrhizobium genosp. L]QPF83339.1 hypothetical protein IC762_27040 [Bradyrhizobium genosp. L]
MDVDKVAAVVSAAGFGVTDRRRNEADDGWCLSFANGAVVEIGDNGKISATGKGAETVGKLLDLPGY